MFFGICNSPATFQAMMDSIFDDMISDSLIIVYMDDMFIFEKDLSPLITNTRLVLRWLRDNDLYLKPSKCEFHKMKIEYLGMIIEEGRISMDTSKLKGIQDWPIPSTVKQVRGFLGFGNFYWWFIRNFSDIAQPLNELLRKDRKFVWTSECQSSFDEIKKPFTEEPVLAMPDHSWPFQIETDALKYATGAVLSQLDSNGDRHPVAFYSKTFSPAKQNYDIHDRELLAIIRLGTIIFKDLDIPLSFFQIIKIWLLIKKPRNWTYNKHDGSYSCQNMTSNWSILLERKWSNLMHYLNDLIIVLLKTTTMKTWF